MEKSADYKICELLRSQSFCAMHSTEWWDLHFQILFIVYSLRYTEDYALELVKEQKNALINNNFGREKIPIALGFENLIQLG